MSVVTRLVVGRINKKVRSKRNRVIKTPVLRDVGEYEYYLAITALGGR